GAGRRPAPERTEVGRAEALRGRTGFTLSPAGERVAAVGRRVRGATYTGVSGALTPNPSPQRGEGRKGRRISSQGSLGLPTLALGPARRLTPCPTAAASSPGSSPR